MERKNQPHILALRARKQRFECARRTQLDVDVFSAREKMQEQLEALVRREIIGTAFARIARSHDERRRQARKFFFESIGDWQKTIETKLEKIRWLNMQLQVLIDAFLLALSLWAAYALPRGRNKSLLYNIEQPFGRPAPDQS